MADKLSTTCPPSPRAAATRQRILDAALAEFAEKGLAGARIDDIAARGGVNKRMIYAYFGNKEDLWLHDRWNAPMRRNGTKKAR